MKKLLLLIALSVLLAGCGETAAPVATPPSPVPTHQSMSPTYTTENPNTPIPYTHTPLKPTQAPTVTSPWHVVQHFTSTVDFFGSPQYNPDRAEQVTVTNPWRIAWQAHHDSTAATGFSIIAVQLDSVGVPEGTTLVYNGSGSGITAPITTVYGDVSLSMSIDLSSTPPSTWSIDIEEESS